MVTSCTVVVLNPYMVRSAGTNGLLKVTVKPVAVGLEAAGGTTKPWTVTGALKPLMGGAVAVVSLTMIVVPMPRPSVLEFSVTLKVCTPLSPATNV